MAGANRKVEGDLDAHLLRWKARYGSFPESIEADKAQELWAAGRKWYIAMVLAPPYCYEKYLGFPPMRTFMFGDQVVVKMNEKSLELAGVEVTYLHKENSHLATVLRRAPVLGKGTETHTVLEVHPAWLKPVRRGLNKSWLGRRQKWEVLEARHWSDIQAQKQQQTPPMLHGPSLSPVSVFPILSQSRL
uniref:Uncharacterized protein n=1 Tax=Chromera velia CCMP2878 TaxID=1169474 RepID=A0A0G4G2G7_9ALVE|eukprot:Cvel_4099.t1-p1 / transcript=Cvel_4099.t1 / gene=Cvel_4099 / organism=Chromera_velia_CCMP2878 / gene_product=hypothetical protein / transcript_product=hypothetical protein / location=Cvel_scaffold174:112503-113230(-) / protein_length=188 / sequence_SO=supercontig / SO=protein_coding / is_pseudo=false